MSEAEQIISTIWSELFETQTIEADANFFELGGDSLLATILAFRVEEALGQPVDPNLLFEYPTLRAFVLEISGQSAGR